MKIEEIGADAQEINSPVQWFYDSMADLREKQIITAVSLALSKLNKPHLPILANHKNSTQSEAVLSHTSPVFLTGKCYSVI